MNSVQKVITIEDPVAGKLKETIVQPTLKETVALQLGKYSSLREAAVVSEFPQLLRDGLKAILFDSYNSLPTTYDQWVRTESSNKPAEDWLELARLGTLPIVAESDPYPEAEGAVDRTVRIVNNKYGMIFSITEEMIKFDRVNMIKQYPQDMGAAAKTTIEEQAYAVLSNAANYTRNSTTGDNDIGANTAATTFSATGLLTAYTTLGTMKDRRSGRYLNIMPDTLIVTPSLEWAAKQLLLSDSLVRASANNAAEVYGTGQANVVRGAVKTIIVTPWLGTSYQWVLMQKNRPVVMQEVEPLQLLIDDVRTVQNEAYFVYDKIRYRVRVWFGVGMLNDRFCFFSSSTSAPAVA